MAEKLSYNEYIDKVTNIFCLSSKEKSILFDLKIENYVAKMKLSIISQMGEKEEFSDILLSCDSSFYNTFLIPLVQKICHVVSIKKKDIVFFSNSGLNTFRMITENNDLFSVDGLSSDDAKNLMILLEKNVQSNEQISFFNNE